MQEAERKFPWVRNNIIARKPLNAPITTMKQFAPTEYLVKPPHLCAFSHEKNNLFVHFSNQVPRFFPSGHKKFDDAEFSSLLRILPQIPDKLTLGNCEITPPMMEKLSQRFVETEHHVSNVQCTEHAWMSKTLKWLLRNESQLFVLMQVVLKKINMAWKETWQ